MVRSALVLFSILFSVLIVSFYILYPDESSCDIDRKLVVNYLMQIDIHGTETKNIDSTLNVIGKQCIYDEFKEVSQDEFEILILTATEYYENYYKTYIEYEKTQKDNEAATDTIKNETLSIDEYIDSYIDGYKIQRKRKMEVWKMIIDKK